MFSSITMASSTTKPTDSVSAISDRLSRLWPSSAMTPKVPTSDMGRARLGMTVADRLRRNRKITSTTRHSVSSRVALTSRTDSRIGCARSIITFRVAEAGSWLRRSGSSACTARETSSVFVPGCRCTASMIARWSTNQLAVRSFCTLSITRPRSCRRTGAPSR